jgi:hypothetical protein
MPTGARTATSTGDRRADGSDWATTHAALRNALQERIVTTLRADDRFVAGWLIGSLGRGEGDDYGDLDVAVVVDTPHADVLCDRPWRSAGRTTAERLDLVQCLALPGDAPAVVHEHHGNADSLGMAGGTLTLVIYERGLELDLFLVPRASAVLPPDARLLFDRVGIPTTPIPATETLVQRREEATAAVAFFWAMAVVAAKYWRRGWDVRFHAMLQDQLHGALASLRRLIDGRPRRYSRVPPIPLEPTREGQAAALRALCDEMESLMRAAVDVLGVDVPTAPRTVVERWLTGP